MVKMNFVYQGNLHCEGKHEPSQSKLETDAPKDNEGKGERFSPTDLVGAALGTCTLTTMAIVAKREKIKFENSRAEVVKEMTPPPRRIQSLKVKIWMPEGLSKIEREKLEAAALHCPVHRSLHPDLDAPIEFIYGES